MEVAETQEENIDGSAKLSCETPSDSSSSVKREHSLVILFLAIEARRRKNPSQTLKALIQNQFWQRRSPNFLTGLGTEVWKQVWLWSSVDGIHWYDTKHCTCRIQSKYLTEHLLLPQKCIFNEIEIFQPYACTKWYSVYPINISWETEVVKWVKTLRVCQKTCFYSKCGRNYLPISWDYQAPHCPVKQSYAPFPTQTFQCNNHLIIHC